MLFDRNLWVSFTPISKNTLISNTCSCSVRYFSWSFGAVAAFDVNLVDVESFSLFTGQVFSTTSLFEIFSFSVLFYTLFGLKNEVILLFVEEAGAALAINLFNLLHSYFSIYYLALITNVFFSSKIFLRFTHNLLMNLS